MRKWHLQVCRHAVDLAASNGINHPSPALGLLPVAKDVRFDPDTSDSGFVELDIEQLRNTTNNTT